MQLHGPLRELRSHSSHSTAAPSVPEAWEGKYVGLLLEFQLYNALASSRVSSNLLLSVVSGTQKVNEVTRKFKIIKLLDDLESLHVEQIPARWVAGSQPYEAGFQKLCAEQMLVFQQKAAKSAQHLMMVEELFKRHAQIRGETKKMQKTKQKEKQNVESAISAWQSWKAASATTATSVPNTAVQPVAQETLSAAYQGIYPWSHTEGEGRKFTTFFGRTQKPILTASSFKIEIHSHKAFPNSPF